MGPGGVGGGASSSSSGVGGSPPSSGSSSGSSSSGPSSGSGGPCVPSKEICDDKDNDCDEQTDEDLGVEICGLGACQEIVDACAGGKPVACSPPSPALAEACDGLDDDCDGQIDESCNCTDEQQQSCYPGSPATLDVGQCQDGVQVCAGDAWGACVGAVIPKSEICDGKDNDCDGLTDEGNPGGGQSCDTGLKGICAKGTIKCQKGSLACVPSVPVSEEACDGLDNDCDGAVDEGDPGGGQSCNTGQQGACSAGTTKCEGGKLGCVALLAAADEKCDGKDNDCDGLTDESDPKAGQSCQSGKPGECAKGTLQCQSGSLVCAPQLSPAEEKCDGKDNDCDGLTDEGNPGGGQSCNTGQKGECAKGTTKCQQGAPVCVQSLKPAWEVCDGHDNDCDGAVDEGNPGGGAGCNTGLKGVCAKGTMQCQSGSLECAQAVAASSEICDGEDDDCDGESDEDTPEAGQSCNTWQPGVCAKGTTICSGGLVLCQPKVQASAEVCDGQDNDCDGKTDENNPGGGQSCQSGQLGECGNGVLQCQGGKLACAAQHQPSLEMCDGKDNDCDGKTDENNPGGGGGCSTGLKGVCSPGTIQCQSGTLGCVPNEHPAPEQCDGKDNDCDGEIDENNPGGGQSCSTGKLGECAAGTLYCHDGAIGCVQNVEEIPEICDGKDNDCDALTDEGNPGGGKSCQSGQKGACAIGETACLKGAVGCEQTIYPTSEVCDDGLDNDCEGTVDNGCKCAHDKCDAGGAMVADCDQCVTNVCGLDAYCCDVQWDATCVAKVRTVCGSLICAEAKGSCPHSPCQTGDGATPLPQGCDAEKAGCVAQICAKDPYCCAVDWDPICVSMVGSVCALSCN
ncbi:MAG: hypothetical protein HY744_28510 [Deltaproteobacteria bacterium]|nr:hypothetical protein [Deltaproteobacteria bacterium]